MVCGQLYVIEAYKFLFFIIVMRLLNKELGIVKSRLHEMIISVFWLMTAKIR